MNDNSTESNGDDLVTARIKRFRNHPFWSIVIFVVGVLSVIFVLWKNIANQTIFESVSHLPAVLGLSETHDDCLAKAEAAMKGILECHQKFGRL